MRPTVPADLLYVASHAYAASISLASVAVDDLPDPLAVNTTTPTFSWAVNSPSVRGAGFAAAQVQVFSGSDTIWDSGNVTTTETRLAYSGPALSARSDYTFSVRLSDTTGSWTDWSSGTFGTGLFDETDWSSAQWIGASTSLVDEPILRTNFTITKEISKAKLFIAGLGNYEAYINGGRVGDHYLAPGFTTYSRRYLYDTHDITSQLTVGENAIGIAVGQAWFPLYYYGPSEDHGAWDGNMRARAQVLISFSDGTQQTIVTDDSWKGKAGGSTSGAATPDNELFDEREEPPTSEWASASFDSSSWPNAIVQTPPATIAQSTPMEPVRIMEAISAVSITNPASGVWVYDFGRNIAGFAAATLDEAAGTQVDLHYTEKLSSSGRVVNEGSRYQFSTYITAGNGSRTFLPRSSYYGFRYIELTGVAGTPNAQTVVAHRLHSDVQGIGWFSTSDTLLQWIHDTTWQTILNNIEGVPTDGAYVEKLPWTADAAVMSETAFSSLNLKALYTKWVQDITDSGLQSGNIAPWAPSPLEMDDYPSAAWGNSYPEVVWQLYQHYGDISVLSRFYDRIKTYVDYEINSRGSAGLVGTESWGDWVTPSVNDHILVGTAFLYRSITRLVDIALTLGNTADVETYNSYAAAVNASFHEAFYQTATQDYRNDTTATFVQTNNLLPVAFNMTNPVSQQSIVDKVAADVVANDNHLNTGLHGTKWILPVLTQFGYKDLAYLVATQTTYPSWGYWQTLGATTLFEAWDSTARSNDHPFLGTVVDWFYQYLAGIKITGAGYSTISVMPYVPEGLASAQSSIQTARGKVESSWTNSTTQFSLSLTVPAGSVARVSLPVSSGQTVYEAGISAASASGVTAQVSETGRALFDVVSGTYSFTVE
ncbi:bacterial alpha-L-rhamnosidase-domain-containing protein [Pestalotiopsis sp. NC0098]|nr:bacterial alpha-L-rhamnosidase-domain-containing protein [Pestalotiopsis sp. NC0098]